MNNLQTKSHQTNETLLTLGHKKKCTLTDTLAASFTAAQR